MLLGSSPTLCFGIALTPNDDVVPVVETVPPTTEAPTTTAPTILLVTPDCSATNEPTALFTATETPSAACILGWYVLVGMFGQCPWVLHADNACACVKLMNMSEILDDCLSFR